MRITLPTVIRLILACSTPAFSVANGQEENLSFKAMLTIQVSLDRQNFSPGCIDGHSGSQTRYALMAWQESKKLPATGEIGPAEIKRLGTMTNVYTTYIVTSNDLASLVRIPAGWKEKSRLPRMGYASIKEMAAEKFHTKESLIESLNPSAAWPDPPAGTILKAPNVKLTPEYMQASNIVVNLGRKYVRVYNDKGQVIAHYPCSIAAKMEKRPVGLLKVINAGNEPDYTYDPALFANDPANPGASTKLIINPGPNNPVGIAWIGLSLSGYGIHGSPDPEDIGKTESHGCFRLANWNAARLLKIVRIGMPVRIEK